MVVGLGEELDPAPIIQICAPSGLCCHALVDGQNGGSAPIEDGYTTLLDPLANALSGRVGRAHCCARPPPEPDVHVSIHPAQASPVGSLAGRSAGLLLLRA